MDSSAKALAAEVAASVLRNRGAPAPVAEAAERFLPKVLDIAEAAFARGDDPIHELEVMMTAVEELARQHARAKFGGPKR